jgi:4-hydroxy-tetrahydrodipicolinate reductase
MGREVCRAIAASPDLHLIAAVDPAHAGTEIEGVSVAASLDAVTDVSAEVVVDFTRPDAVMGTILWCLEHGVHVVVGTTGITQENLDELRAITSGARSNILVAPNFAIGAVLMMRFAERAAKYFPATEIVELHHDAKVDAPSGTALVTARRIAAARGRAAPPAVAGDDAHPGARGADVEGVRVHAVRLPGFLAHEEVIMGGQGQTLTIRHDTTDRSAFIPGVLLAIESISDLPGLTVGIESLLEDG